MGYDLLQSSTHTFCGQSDVAEKWCHILFLCELSTNFEVNADSPRGEISCVMAREPLLVTPLLVLCFSTKEAHAKFSNPTNVGKNVNLNQVRGHVTLLLSYFFSYVFLTGV